MSTYAQDQAVKRIAALPTKARFVYRAAGYDRILPHGHLPDDGTIVVKNQPFGCPKNGTLGHCYVADATTGQFIGLVDQRSLTPVRRRRRV
jgi:ornithine cyclodeaminase/alanine dehydrogenase-like protein (mu-crystallin family)